MTRRAIASALLALGLVSGCGVSPAKTTIEAWPPAGERNYERGVYRITDDRTGATCYVAIYQGRGIAIDCLEAPADE
jgi:hypothetical protein